jgi:hypothetical protein
VQPRTQARIGKNATKLADECISSRMWGLYKASSGKIVLDRLLDDRLIPDLPRSRGRSIGGHLDIGEEGTEQMIVTLQSQHHGSVGYQLMHTRVDLTKKTYPCKCNLEHKKE